MPQNLLDDDLKTPLIQLYGINKKDRISQLMIWFGIFLGCFMLAQVISSLIILMYYKSVDMKVIASDPYDLNVLRFVQMVATVFGFLLPALIFSKLKDNPITKYANADIGFNLVFLILIPLLIIAFYPMINLSYFINKWMPWSEWRMDFQDEYKIIVDALLKDNSILALIINLITIALLPAICEEWIFRGTFQKYLSEKLNFHLAIFLAALFFSFIHLEFSGFLPRIILGMFLGYIFYYTGSLWSSIFAHAVNNGAQVIFMYLNNNGIYKIDVDHPEMPQILEIIIYSAGFVVLWMIFYHFVQKNKKSNFAK